MLPEQKLKRSHLIASLAFLQSPQFRSDFVNYFAVENLLCTIFLRDCFLCSFSLSHCALPPLAKTFLGSDAELFGQRQPVPFQSFCG